MLARTLISISLFFLSAGALAEDSAAHYGAKEEGWYWYKDPKEIKKTDPSPEKKAEAPPEKPEPPKEEAKIKPEDIPFSTAWLKANLDRLREEAMDSPDDPDKIRAYLYAQRLVLDKAQNFATAAHRMANLDPLLDESNRVPIDTAAKMAVMRTSNAAKEEALRRLAKKAGLFFFFDSSCSHCLTQQEALGWMVKDYAFSIKNISVDGKGLPGMHTWVKDDGQAKALGLKIFPTTIFVVPPDGYYIISQGTLSAESMGNKIILVANDRKLLDEDVARHINVFDRGVLSAKDMRDPALAEAIRNSRESKIWVNQLREKLGTNY